MEKDNNEVMDEIYAFLKDLAYNKNIQVPKWIENRAKEIFTDIQNLIP